jgi:hypothetical protein
MHFSHDTRPHQSQPKKKTYATKSFYIYISDKTTIRTEMTGPMNAQLGATNVMSPRPPACPASESRLQPLPLRRVVGVGELDPVIPAQCLRPELGVHERSGLLPLATEGNPPLPVAVRALLLLDVRPTAGVRPQASVLANVDELPAVATAPLAEPQLVVVIVPAPG